MISLKGTAMQIEKALINDHLPCFKSIQLWMRKVQCLLFMLNGSYISYYIICMIVPLTSQPEGRLKLK